MLTGTLEELSNQRRSKKIGDSAETKETELDMLQRQRQKKQKIENAEGEESFKACCSNC